MGLSPKLLQFCLRNVKRSYIIIIPPDCPEHWREYNHHPSATSIHVAKTKVPALWGKESKTIHAIRKWIIVDLLNIITVRWSRKQSDHQRFPGPIPTQSNIYIGSGSRIRIRIKDQEGSSYYHVIMSHHGWAWNNRLNYSYVSMRLNGRWLHSRQKNNI